MRKLGLIIFMIIATILIAGCASTSTVTGTVTYREKIALPAEGIVVVIKVEDISRADAPAVTIGEQIIENPRQPIPFEINYDPNDIDERYTYAMRVRIEADGKLLFTNTSRYAVITRGNPTNDIEVIVDKVG